MSGETVNHWTPVLFVQGDPTPYVEDASGQVVPLNVFVGSDGTVTPFQFGAVGDGVADDTLPVQAAINSGYLVDLGSSIFRVTATLQLHESVIAGYFAGIIGNGNAKIRADHTGDGISDSVHGPANHVTLSGFILECVDAANVAGRGIVIDSAYYVNMNTLDVSLFGSHGIAAIGGIAGPNCAFWNIGKGVRSHGNGGSGIYVEDRAGANNFHIGGDGWCELSGNGRYGFEQPIVPLFANQSVIDISKVGFQANTLGSIYADLLRASNISNCYFENGLGGTQVHIRLGEGNSGAIHGSVTGTSIDSNFFACVNADYAISATGVTGSPDCTARDNRFDGTAGQGIAAIISQGHQDWDLQGNRLSTGWAPDMIVAASAVSGIGDNVWNNTNSVRSGHRYGDNTFQDLLRLFNSKAATNGNQKYGPVLFSEGQGFASGPATSMAVKAGMAVAPVQGVATPSGELHFITDINGAGWVSRGKITSGGLWIPDVALVLPAGGAQSALSGRIRAPNNVDIITVRNGANGADFGILNVDAGDAVYLLGSDGTSYLVVDSTNARIRAVMTTFQHLLPAGTQILQTADPANDTETSLTIRRNVAGVKGNKIVKFAAAPPGGSQLLYMDP